MALRFGSDFKFQTAEDEVQRLQGTLMAMDQVMDPSAKQFVPIDGPYVD